MTLKLLAHYHLILRFSTAKTCSLGYPDDMTTDQGVPFIAAENYLKSVHQSKDGQYICAD
jgi:hypothetical protein